MEGLAANTPANHKARASHPLIGRIIAERFQITSFIGDGRIAQVFCAQQENQPRHVALKVVLPAFTADPDVVGRFLFAAEKCKRLQHPAIVPTHAAGEDRDVLYLATDLVLGDNLRSAIDARGPMTRAAALRIACDICRALEYALSVGVLHRGLRPTNVLLTRTPEAPELEIVKLCDFAMSDVVDVLRARDPYGAPERERGEANDSRADVFALGALLFELLSGRPYRREGPADASRALVRERQQHAQKPAPVELDVLAVMERALEPDARDRFSSIRELSAELGKLLAGVDGKSPALPQQSAELAPFRSLVADTWTERATEEEAPSVDAARAPAVEPAQDFALGLIGRTLDERFQVDSFMRSGGMAHLFYGTCVDQNQRVVIKVLHPRLAEEPGLVKRFAREARLAAQLKHPNIIHIVHVGDLYIAMELLNGEDLSRRLRQRGRLPEAHAAQIAIEIASALAYAHGRSVVHRDIKPGNVMICAGPDGEYVKLLDFGIAKLLENTRDRIVSADLTLNRSALTSVGDLVGTPRYMSPEQGRAEAIDRRTDLYSLGVVLYELTTGRVPFDGETALQIVARHVQDEPRPPGELAPDISPELEQLILELLQKDPAHRPSSAKEVKRRLEAMLPDLGLSPATATKRWYSSSEDDAGMAWDADPSLIFLPAEEVRGVLDDVLANPQKPDPAREPEASAPRSAERAIESPSARPLVDDPLLQAQRLESLRCLAGGVSDNLDNALSAILGFASLISSALRLGDPLLDDVSQISRAAEGAASLSAQLAAFSGRQVLTPRILDVRAHLAEMEPVVRRLIGQGLSLELELGPTKPVEVDPRQLEQAVLNLVLNAREAMPEGGTVALDTASVTIDHTNAHEHGETPFGDYVLVSVSDTGRGMPPAVRARAFEPFFTTKPSGQGVAGMGLSVVSGIVRQSGGHVLIFSGEGQGTQVEMYLPVKALALGDERRAPDSIRVQADETVLVVEEEALMRAFLRTTLARAGYRVLEAESADEALRIGAEHRGPLHLLLTSTATARVNGSQLAERLAQTRPGLAVVFMSGSTDRPSMPPPSEPGANDILVKPIAPTALLLTVRKALGR